MKLLGPSIIGITLDTYSLVLPVMQEEAAQKIDTVLRAALDGTLKARRNNVEEVPSQT